MTIRPLRLPEDLSPMLDMAIRTFQYPENPEWSVQADEKTDTVRTIRTLRRLWPLLRTLQVISPSLRDLFRGCVWEAGGELIGVAMTQREGATDMWIVSTVGVVPEQRRRGIARALVTRAIDELRSRGASKVTLEVIDRNIPAYALYTSLGFKPCGGRVVLHCKPSEPPVVPALAKGYRQLLLKPSDWRTRYELDSRIVPPELRTYDPVVIARYRTAPLLRLFVPLLRWASGREERKTAIRRVSDGAVVGLGQYSVPRRPGGRDSIEVLLDPNCSELADYLVAHQLERAMTRGPGRRVTLTAPNWMPSVVEAALARGFTRRLEYRLLGLTI